MIGDSGIVRRHHVQGEACRQAPGGSDVTRSHPAGRMALADQMAVQNMGRGTTPVRYRRAGFPVRPWHEAISSAWGYAMETQFHPAAVSLLISVKINHLMRYEAGKQLLGRLLMFRRFTGGARKREVPVQSQVPGMAVVGMVAGNVLGQIGRIAGVLMAPGDGRLQRQHSEQDPAEGRPSLMAVKSRPTHGKNPSYTSLRVRIDPSRRQSSCKIHRSPLQFVGATAGR